jgi:hypothetical protein
MVAAEISTTVAVTAIVVDVVDAVAAAATRAHRETIVTRSTRWIPTSP